MTTELTFDELELWVLHACMVEAKFHEDPRDLDIPGGPLVAALVNKIADALQDSERFGSDETWQTWRTLTPDREEWRNALMFVKHRGDWLDRPTPQQLEYARCLLSPFHVSDELLERCVSEAREYRDRLPPRVYPEADEE
jgi:hypothetical protein